MFEKEAEEYRKDLKSKFFLSEPQLDFACQGFKDGFNKANEWHDLRKDPNDLPKNNAMVLTRLKNKRLKISTFMENKFIIWNKDYDTYTKLYEVIAWCEIPKFEE